jgi:hypothetical protein
MENASERLDGPIAVNVQKLRKAYLEGGDDQKLVVKDSIDTLGSAMAGILFSRGDYGFLRGLGIEPGGQYASVPIRDKSGQDFIEIKKYRSAIEDLLNLRKEITSIEYRAVVV